MAERMTRAMCDAAGTHLRCSFPDCACKETPKMARAGLAAMIGPDARGRWPGTAAMLDAGVVAFDRAAARHGLRESLMAAWNAMLRAAADA